MYNTMIQKQKNIASACKEQRGIVLVYKNVL